MATIICPISGLEFKVAHVPMILREGELAHPIFYLKQDKLLSLYARYNSESSLNDIDSYLLFLALLNHTEQVRFDDPVKYRGKITQTIITNYIDRLVKIIWETDSIWHPTFKQPSFVVKADNHTNSLSNINEWIKLWEGNIAVFKLAPMLRRQRKTLKDIEAKLEHVINSGDRSTRLAAAVATWADKAAGFPDDKRELWMKTIRSCYNEHKMFITSKELLQEIISYCELNLEPGGLYFHTLHSTIREGIKSQSNYLGLDPIPHIRANYQLIPEDADTNTVAIMSIIDSSPKEEPMRQDFPSELAFIRAKLKYRVYQQYEKTATEAKPDDSITTSTVGENINV